MKTILYGILILILAIYFAATYKASTEEVRTMNQMMTRTERIWCATFWAMLLIAALAFAAISLL